jgi:hypothetical protein
MNLRRSFAQVEFILEFIFAQYDQLGLAVDLL